METGHPSTRAVNSGRQLGQWKPGFSLVFNVLFVRRMPANEYANQLVFIRQFSVLKCLNSGGGKDGF